MNKRYANYYNTRYRLTGHVFEKRYYGKWIDNDSGTHISHPSDENREDFFASMWNESLTHKECKGVCPPWMFKFVRFMTVPI
jgi:hypothetical protein